jgi:hypothetical protein
MLYEQQATGTTPLVRFDIDKNSFLIEGRSLAENAMEFYGAAIDWLDENLQNRKTNATVVVKLDYCNTSSFLGMSQLLQKLKQLNSNGSSFTVKWIYEKGDEDWLEDGRNFQEAVDLPFEFESFVASSQIE